jgi:hypothetical protein
MASLPLLEELLITADMARSCCLTPLATASSLRILMLSLPECVLDASANIEALRNMPRLRSLAFHPAPAAFIRMLQPPHSMILESLVIFPPFTAECGDAIVHLPNLTKIHFELSSTHTDFLHSLPNLRSLSFNAQLCTVLPDADRIMHSLHSLVGLTELQIEGNVHSELQFPFLFTSAHLIACLPHMPLLTRLRLTDASGLDSLRFLSTGPVTRSLKELEICFLNPPLPLRELLHVHALSSLTRLTLMSTFDRPLDDHALPLYTPPSLLLPALREFSYEHSASDDDEEDEED